jgi:hypothetical protein
MIFTLPCLLALSIFAISPSNAATLRNPRDTLTSRSDDVSEESQDLQQHFTFPFESRNLAGKVDIHVKANDDDEHAFGLDLIYADVHPADIRSQFHGFPVVSGTITYPIPASPFSGYGSLFGWIQFTKTDVQGEEDGDWEMDIYPYAADIPNPFGIWGFTPALFDAPGTKKDPSGNNTAVVWRAQAYLCILGDGGLTKNVSVIPGAGFKWGYDIDVDQKTPAEREILIKQVEILDVTSEWPQRLPLLKESYKDFIFNDISK